MKEVKYNNHKYRTDGKNIWKDGVLLDIVGLENPVNVILAIEALKVDGYIYYDGRVYSPATN